MLCVRGLQRLKAALNPRGNIRYRSLTSDGVRHKDDRSLTSDGVRHKDDAIVKIENPYKEPPKLCTLCNVTVDFKNIQLLSQFVSPFTGMIYSRQITGLCGRKQKEISKAIKKAHAMGFMSVTHKHPQFMGDPNICGVKNLK